MKTILFIIAVIIIYKIVTGALNKNKKRIGDFELEASIGKRGADSDTPTYENLDQWKEDATTIWKGDPQTIVFSYRDAQGDKSRRKVDVRNVIKTSRGIIYLQDLSARILPSEK